MSEVSILTTERVPFVGPRPFDRSESDLFFGRGREVSDLVSLVYSAKVTVLYAQSGAGKTSLLNAGLLPALEEEGFVCFPGGRVGGGEPQSASDGAAGNVFASELIASLQEQRPDALATMTIADYIERRRGADVIPSEVPVVVFIDQAEELLTHWLGQWRSRAVFFEQVLQALREDPLLRVVLSLREEFIAEMEPYLAVLPAEFRTGMRLECLRKPEAMEAIQSPLQATGKCFAEGVARSLTEDLAKVRAIDASGNVEEFEGEFVEPVHLQVLCRLLWGSLPPGATTITAEHLQTSGDVNDALIAFYDRAVSEAAGGSRVVERRIRTWIEDNLVTGSGTRGMVHRDLQTTNGLPNDLVDKLEDLHIVRAEWRAGSRWYELPHDRLVEPVLLRALDSFKLDRGQQSVVSTMRRVMMGLWSHPLVILGLLLYLATIPVMAVLTAFTSAGITVAVSSSLLVLAMVFMLLGMRSLHSRRAAIRRMLHTVPRAVAPERRRS